MVGLGAFAKEMRRKAEAVETAASRLSVIGTRAAVETLVYITPVDTSEHLSNWQVMLGNAPADSLPPYVPGSRGSTRGASAQQAIAEANAELAYKRPGQRLYISNLGPAIGALDEGSSSQFPGGFVPRAVISFRTAMLAAVARGAVFNEKVVA